MVSAGLGKWRDEGDGVRWAEDSRVCGRPRGGYDGDRRRGEENKAAGQGPRESRHRLRGYRRDFGRYLREMCIRCGEMGTGETSDIDGGTGHECKGRQNGGWAVIRLCKGPVEYRSKENTGKGTGN